MPVQVGDVVDAFLFSGAALGGALGLYPRQIEVKANVYVFNYPLETFSRFFFVACSLWYLSAPLSRVVHM